MSNRRDSLRITGGMMVAGGGILLPGWALARKDSVGPATLPAGTLEESIFATLPG
jgi:hypothetical protein